MSDILNREERIAHAKRFAPQNDVQTREGLAIGELITVNADMLSMLTDEWRAAVADATALREVIRQAVLDVEKLPHAPSCASGNGEWRLEEKGDCITREFYLYGTPCNCGHAAAIANLKKGLIEK